MTWKKAKPAAAEGCNAPPLASLLEQYGGPIQFNGMCDALFEQHLSFDNVADASEVGVRQQYEALARSMRDIL
ncbi:MAG TPA: hypothetical protein VK362_24305, partial [Reyranella sp.]|nr:hypothetical protein [Reyranella sp.]